MYANNMNENSKGKIDFHVKIHVTYKFIYTCLPKFSIHNNIYTSLYKKKDKYILISTYFMRFLSNQYPNRIK